MLAKLFQAFVDGIPDRDPSAIQLHAGLRELHRPRLRIDLDQLVPDQRFGGGNLGLRRTDARATTFPPQLDHWADSDVERSVRAFGQLARGGQHGLEVVTDRYECAGSAGCREFAELAFGLVVAEDTVESFDPIKNSLGRPVGGLGVRRVECELKIHPHNAVARGETFERPWRLVRREELRKREPTQQGQCEDRAARRGWIHGLAAFFRVSKGRPGGPVTGNGSGSATDGNDNRHRESNRAGARIASGVEWERDR